MADRINIQHTSAPQSAHGRGIKRVTFSEGLNVLTVLRLSDYTQPSNLWYGAREIACFQRMACQRSSSGGHPPAKDSCSRGLESRTIQGAKRKRRIREEVAVAVLELQHFLLKMGIPQDPEVIAEASMQFSQPAKDEARLLGLVDERYVELSIRKTSPILCTKSNLNTGCISESLSTGPACRLSLVGPAA
jgi:hypothetical protein